MTITSSLHQPRWEKFICILKINILKIMVKSKEEGKDRESIQSRVPHLTRDTRWESDKNARKHHKQESHEVSFSPEGDHKAARNIYDGKRKTNVKYE